jgi:hypothetical protein
MVWDMLVELILGYLGPLSIEWFIIDDQEFFAVLWYGSSTTPSPLLPVSSISDTRDVSWTCVSTVELVGGGRSGRGRSQIIRQRENLVFYKSFNIIWTHPSYCPATDWKKERSCWRGRWWVISSIIWQRESQVLYKSTSTLCLELGLERAW